MAAGYSKRSLVQKLGIKAGFKLMLLNPPENYEATLGTLPENVTVLIALDQGPFDFVHFFTKDKDTLEDQFPNLKQALVSNGMLWISWPKASSKVDTDLKEGVVRDIGLANGLVDVKVAAIDETWSGLKFVYRLKDRS
jgi:hypothetical protein